MINKIHEAIHTEEQSSVPEDRALSAGITQKKALFKANMAQLMVLLNGLILTATAYGVINVFIQQTIIDSLERNVHETQIHLSKEISNIEREFYALGSVVSLTDNITAEKLTNFVQDKSFSFDKFDQIYWIEKNTDTTKKEKSWNIQGLLN